VVKESPVTVLAVAVKVRPTPGVPVIVALAIVGAAIAVKAEERVAEPLPLFTTKSNVPTVKVGKTAVMVVEDETLILVKEIPFMVAVV
jgi:hypothetical protein